jgi:heme exporter protein A
VRVDSPAIEVSGLVRRFGDREAVAGVTFSVESGSTLVVFGPNGAGKTTLLRVLATLLLPHAGVTNVLGCVLPRDAHALRPKVGLLAHEPLLYRELSGRENLDFYGRLYGLADRRARIEALLAATAMTGRADEPVRELSRGMVQRLAVCRAVLHEPDLLLLDEPRAGLDPDAGELIEPLIGRARGCTRIVVTHEVEAGLEEADRVIGLRAGRIAFDRRPEELSVEQVRALYSKAEGAL